MEYALISQVCFVALVRNIACEVGPRNAICSFHEVGVRDGAETLANVGRVGDIAMC